MATETLVISSIGELEQVVQDAVFYDDVKLAERLVVQIEQKRIPIAAEDTARLESLKLDLDFIRLASLPDEQSLRLIREHLVDAFILPEYDFLDAIGRKIAIMEWPEDKIAYMEQLLSVIKSCTETLGNKPIKIENRSVDPLVKNWLNDYLSFPTKSTTRTSLEELHYIDNSPNVSGLPKEQREVLLDILKLHDALVNRVNAYRQVPEAKNEDDALKGFDLIDYVTAFSVAAGTQDKAIDLDLSRVNLTKTFVPPIAPPITRPTSSAPVVEKAEVEPTPQPEKFVEPTPPEPVTKFSDIKLEPLPSLNLGPRPDQNPVNLQELLKKNIEAAEQARGVQMGGEQAPEARPPAPAKPVSLDAVQPEAPKPASPEEQINKKLEQLKNKTSQG